MTGRRSREIRRWHWLAPVVVALVAGLLAFGRDGVSFAAPGQGLFVFGARDGIALTSPNAGGGNPLINWATLEPQKGVYDWSSLDKAIADAKAHGKKIIPRVYTNIDANGQASPAWFFATPGAMYYYPSASAQSRGYKAPVPWDQVYRDEFGRFVSALGARYNGNPTIEFFQTNAGGGMYGEQYMGNQAPGYSAALQIKMTELWLNKWHRVFPNTHLAVMVNYIGGNIGEEVSAYAASLGIYLQQNTAWISSGAMNLFKANASKTKIIVDADDACTYATGSAFDQLTARVLSYGSPVDYVLLCYKSFSDPATAAKLPAFNSQLRH